MHYTKSSEVDRAWPIYIVRRGPFLVRKVFSNEKPNPKPTQDCWRVADSPEKTAWLADSISQEFDRRSKRSSIKLFQITHQVP